MLMLFTAAAVTTTSRGQSICCVFVAASARERNTEHCCSAWAPLQSLQQRGRTRRIDQEDFDLIGGAIFRECVKR